MDILALLVWFILPAALLLDLVHRAKPYRRARAWRIRALLVSVAVIAIEMGVASFWGRTFAGVSLFDVGGLGVWGAAAAGVLVYEFALYWYHRFAHRNDHLWRWAHQMHHSAESLDAWGANYFSPLDIAIFATLSSLVFFPLLGLPVEAGVLAAFFLACNAVFQHASVRTPRWLGYLIQRPESHSLHHGRGVHAHNYADLPLWDVLFGTFANPRDFREEVGFRPGTSARIPAMLLGRDVSADDGPVAVDATDPEDPAGAAAVDRAEPRAPRATGPAA